VLLQCLYLRLHVLIPIQHTRIAKPHLIHLPPSHTYLLLPILYASLQVVQTTSQITILTQLLITQPTQVCLLLQLPLYLPLQLLILLL